MKSFARKFLLVLFVTELVWAALLAFAPSSGQMRLFFVDEHGWFCDYRMPRGCADSERTYVPDETFRRDACYPPICYDFVKLFPHDRVRGGATHAGFGVVVLALGLVVLLRRRMSCLSTAATMAAVLVSWPGLLTVGVSNQILFAAGFVCIFFAWHEDDAPLLGRFMPSLRRRHAALAFLALAIAFKLTPVFFALWLVRARRRFGARWRWRGMLCWGWGWTSSTSAPGVRSGVPSILPSPPFRFGCFFVRAAKRGGWSFLSRRCWWRRPAT